MHNTYYGKILIFHEKNDDINNRWSLTGHSKGIAQRLIVCKAHRLLESSTHQLLSVMKQPLVIVQKITAKRHEHWLPSFFSPSYLAPTISHELASYFL